MKINSFYILILLVSYYSFSQKIEVNNTKIVTLIFPSNVIKATTGNSDFLIEYDKVNPSPILFLKSKETTKESNLVVKTDSDILYNLNLVFSKNISSTKNNIIIDEKDGYSLAKKDVELVQLEIPKLTNTLDSKVLLDEKKALNIRENDYTIGNTIINDSENKQLECKECKDLIESSKKIKRIFDENYNIKVQLNNVFYLNSRLYFIIEFINKSDLDYNLNYIKSYIDTGKKSKYASTQYLEKNPILIYNSIRKIPGNSNRKFLFVYDQFSIDENKNMTFEINENNGERNIFLKIPNLLINNPQ